MPVNYNFAFKNSKLKEWNRPDKSNNVLSSDISFKKKLTYLFEVFIKNPEIFYPSTCICLLTILVHIGSIYPTRIINKLEPMHIEYTLITKKLSSLQKRLNIMKKHMDNVNDFYTKATPSYLFAFYLQNSVPQGVQINDYFVSDNGFDITAKAYNIEPLNEFLTLVIESPIIKRNSVVVEKIIRKEGAISSSDSSNSDVVLKIKGNILKLTMKKRESLYVEASAEGLLRKLSRFNYLNRLIRS